MNTATARRPKSLGSCPTEKKAVSLNQDAQLQKLLKDGWEIAQEGAIEIRLTKPGGKMRRSNESPLTTGFELPLSNWNTSKPVCRSLVDERLTR